MTYLAEDGGSILGADRQRIAKGKDATVVEAIPDEGYSFVKWSDGARTQERWDWNITGDLTLTAFFEENTDPSKAADPIVKPAKTGAAAVLFEEVSLKPLDGEELDSAIKTVELFLNRLKRGRGLVSGDVRIKTKQVGSASGFGYGYPSYEMTYELKNFHGSTRNSPDAIVKMPQQNGVTYYADQTRALEVADTQSTEYEVENASTTLAQTALEAVGLDNLYIILSNPTVGNSTLQYAKEEDLLYLSVGTQTKDNVTVSAQAVFQDGYLVASDYSYTASGLYVYTQTVEIGKDITVSLPTGAKKVSGVPAWLDVPVDFSLHAFEDDGMTTVTENYKVGKIAQSLAIAMNTIFQYGLEPSLGRGNIYCKLQNEYAASETIFDVSHGDSDFIYKRAYGQDIDRKMEEFTCEQYLDGSVLYEDLKYADKEAGHKQYEDDGEAEAYFDFLNVDFAKNLTFPIDLYSTMMSGQTNPYSYLIEGFTFKEKQIGSYKLYKIEYTNETYHNSGNDGGAGDAMLADDFADGDEVPNTDALIANGYYLFNQSGSLCGAYVTVTRREPGEDGPIETTSHMLLCVGNYSVEMPNDVDVYKQSSETRPFIVW